MYKIKSKFSSTLILILILVSTNSYSQSLWNTDSTLFRSINNNRSHFLDAIIPVVDKSVFPMVAISPVALFTFGRINKVPYDENSGVLLAVSEVTSYGVTFALKNMIKRKRPYQAFENVYSKKNNSPTDDYSFPSGHTTEAFTLATSLSLRYSDEPLLIGGLYLYALTVSYGRIYLGVHYPGDVIAGALIGTGTSVLVYSLRKEIIKAKNNIFGTENNVDQVSEGNNNAFMILGSVLAGDLINSLFLSSNNKVFSRTRLGLELNGKFNRVQMQIGF
ncbi:hypothetical protein BH10BAC5_BH10BAC5_02010 [soil metagenome]